MMYYVLTRDGVLLGVTVQSPYDLNLEGVSIHEFDEVIPDLNVYTWDDTTQMMVRGISSRSLTKLQFINRMTLQERIAISASTDPVISDIMRMLNIAEYVSLDDGNTIQAIQYFAMTGLLAPSRVSEILQ